MSAKRHATTDVDYVHLPRLDIALKLMPCIVGELKGVRATGDATLMLARWAAMLERVHREMRRQREVWAAEPEDE